MRTPVDRFFFALLIVASLGLVGCPSESRQRADEIHKEVPRQSESVQLVISYPSEGTVFPPEIAPPTFRWEFHPRNGNLRWRVSLDFADGGEPLRADSDTAQWCPSHDLWEEIKQRSVEQAVRITVRGCPTQDPETVVAEGSVRFSTSADEVGAPLFFREVNLPFLDAVKNPAAYIRWRFGEISSEEPPPIVLEKLPVCGNCHSFSADASVFGVDVDYANDKGSYAICPVSDETCLCDENIITWCDFQKEDGKKTFGLLSQVSPDGRYVVSTVKDLSVFQAVDNLTFSQLFFPIRGILCVYDRVTKTYRALPGADDERFVQSNPTWSPDGKQIVFARSAAYYGQEAKANELGLTQVEEISRFLAERKTFQYDLYRVPFHEGQGGEAEPLAGASQNGKSNYFARYSPDGRWIVFCQAESFMLLQPDSELYIIPAEGGVARRLGCNTDRMNSWHSWTPNGKWLVFSSKAFSDYTQLFLTHVDEAGESTPPVLLKNFTADNRAANIPEFVNASPTAIERIREAFLDDTNYLRAGDEYRKQRDYPGAIELYRKALELNPDNALVHTNWGLCLV